MSFRTVLITQKCKLSYKNDHLIVRNEELTMVHLSEIENLIIDSTQVLLTTYLLNELVKRKIFVVFCDEARNPQCQLLSLYGSHNTSKKIKFQIAWENSIKQTVWTHIITEKINNQSQLLASSGKKESLMLNNYSMAIELNDTTNREGHAAKVYFNSLFGKKFSRNNSSDINKALDYGYAIILSSFNKEIVSNGYLTQLGICHKNEFNQFNLSCDLMEPFRILVDKIVYVNKEREFSTLYKHDLVAVLNETVKVEDKIQFVSNAIKIYVKSIFEALNTNEISAVKTFKIQF